VFSTKIFDYGGRRGDVMRALTRWWHPVALSEAQDVIHWAMCPALHCFIRMAIEITINVPAFFVSSIRCLHIM